MKRSYPYKIAFAVLAVLLSLSVAFVVFSQGSGRGTRPQNKTSTKPSPAKKPARTGPNAPMSRSSNVPAKTIKTQNGIEMVWIPPGSFMMGADNGDFDEKPEHEVTIKYPFYMGKYEVTQSQWQVLMGSNTSYFKECVGKCPVETVSWNDVKEFITKLNQLHDGYTYRLPSEAEWEYACRAGTTTAFAFGDSLSSGQANFDSDYPYRGAGRGLNRRKTTPVGSFQPNAWGLYDMHGNVWEWCQDWYHDNYSGAPTDGSAWLTGGEQQHRVLRGGSWDTSSRNLRSASRFWGMPDLFHQSIGFRIVAVARTQ